MSLLEAMPMGSFWWYALGLAIILYIFRQPILSLYIPGRLPGFPAPSNPHPIFGDLDLLRKGARRYGGPTIHFEELVKELGPNFQLRAFKKRFVSLN